MSEQDEKSCDFCGSSGVLLQDFASSSFGPMQGRTKTLCRLCSHTVAGNALEYPDHYPSKDAMKVICFIGNEILKAIKAGDDPSR